MTLLFLTPAIVGYTLLALHFYRADNLPAMLCAVLPIAAMVIRHPLIARILQVCLLIGAVEWLRTTVILVDHRMEAGQPWLRLALILGSVALATALAAMVFQQARVRNHFRLPSKQRCRRYRAVGKPVASSQQKKLFCLFLFRYHLSRKGREPVVRLRRDPVDRRADNERFDAPAGGSHCRRPWRTTRRSAGTQCPAGERAVR
jgi:hypothetical protein